MNAFHYLMLAGFVGPMMDATGFIPHRAPRVRYTKNGGMRFLRIGRLQTSWCICKRGL